MKNDRYRKSIEICDRHRRGSVRSGSDRESSEGRKGTAGHRGEELPQRSPSAALTAGDIGVRVFTYDGNNMELGAICGKPFSVSALAVIDKGTSNILSL